MDIVAWLAIGIALYAAVISHMTANKQGAMQQHLLSIENTRERDRKEDRHTASLRAAITQEGNAHYLVVRNEGLGEARAIRILVNGAEAPDGEYVLEVLGRFRVLGPGASGKYHLRYHMGMETRDKHVEIEWENLTGQPGRWASDLTP